MFTPNHTARLAIAVYHAAPVRIHGVRPQRLSRTFSNVRPRRSNKSPFQVDAGWSRPKENPFKHEPAATTKSSGGIKTIWLALALGLGGNIIYKIYYPSEDTQRLLSKIKGEAAGVLDKQKFSEFQIVQKEDVSSTCSIITVRPGKPQKADPYAYQWQHGLWSVEFKQPELQIARSYTPLPPTSAMTLGDLRFLIRREHKGEVSNYLSNLPQGSNIHIRGPREELEIESNVSEIVFLAGGTGIAPALQAAHTLLAMRPSQGDSDKPRIKVLWANRRREDCIGGPVPSSSWFSFGRPAPRERPNALVHEMNDLERRYPGRFNVEYYVDEDKSFLKAKDIRKACDGDVDGSMGKRLLLVSGPDGFVSHLAGPRSVVDGQEAQGPVRGVVGGIRLEGWQVFKL